MVAGEAHRPTGFWRMRESRDCIVRSFVQ